MRANLKRVPQKSPDLSKMRHPKPLKDRSSLQKNTLYKPNAKTGLPKSAGSSNFSNSFENTSNTSKSPQSNAFKNGSTDTEYQQEMTATVKSVTECVLSIKLKPNAPAAVRNRLQTHLQPHVKLLYDSVVPQTDVGREILTDGRVIKKIIQICALGSQYPLKTLLHNIKMNNMKGIRNNIQELHQYYEETIYKCQPLESSDSSPEITRYNIDGQEIKDTTSQTDSVYQSKDHVEFMPLCDIKEVQDHATYKIVISGSEESKATFLQHVGAVNNLKQNIKAKQFQIHNGNYGSLYPTFQDYPSRSVQTGLRTEQLKQRSFQTQVLQAMSVVFGDCEIMNIDDFNIVGIVELDYKNLGVYSILSVKRNTDPHKENLALCPISNIVNIQLMKQIKEKYCKHICMRGWIQNSNNIDVGQYWLKNLNSLIDE